MEIVEIGGEFVVQVTPVFQKSEMLETMGSLGVFLIFGVFVIGLVFHFLMRSHYN